MGIVEHHAVGGERKRAVLSDLKADLRLREERWAHAADKRRGAGAGLVSLGSEVDALMADGGLRRGFIHELRARSYLDIPAALALSAAMASCMTALCVGAVFWLRLARGGLWEAASPYPVGLAERGLDLSTFTLIEAPDLKRLFWAGEEIAREEAASVIIVEIVEGEAAGLTAFRRVQLALEGTGAVALAVRGPHASTASGARTIWSAAGALSAARDGPGRVLPGLGRPCWDVSVRTRGAGAERSFIMESCDETHRFGVAAALGDRPAPAFAG